MSCHDQLDIAQSCSPRSGGSDSAQPGGSALTIDAGTQAAAAHARQSLLQPLCNHCCDVHTTLRAGKYTVLFFYPLDFTFVCPTEVRVHASGVHARGARCTTALRGVLCTQPAATLTLPPRLSRRLWPSATASRSLRPSIAT